MNKLSKILFFIFIIAFFAIMFWGYSIFKERNSFSQEKKSSLIINSEQENEIDEDKNDLNEEENIINDDETNNDSSTENDSFLQVTADDCKKECKDFQDPDDVSYCKEICGLSATKKDSSGCDMLESLEKDYCFKDKAISEKNPKICDKIEDYGIKKACQNRLLEDIVDNQIK